MTFGDYIEELFPKDRSALGKTGGQDQCFICCRGSEEVYEFLTDKVANVYHEEPDSLEQMLRDLQALQSTQPFSLLCYLTERPVCFVCYGQLAAEENYGIIDSIGAQIRKEKGNLWPDWNA